MSYGLTARQRDLLDYLRACELCPSYEEIRTALGWSSKRIVWNEIEELEARDCIRRLPHRDRSIEVVTQISDELGPAFYVVFGPEHFERRAALWRARWAAEKTKACSSITRAVLPLDAGARRPLVPCCG